jgi:GT2 family glycosyltransferase
MDEVFRKPKWFTAVIVVTVPGYIDRCLETLYKYTEKGSFYTYIIDQTIDGLDSTKLRNTYRNLMIIRTPKSDLHHTGNLGHSQGTNLGLSLVTTPYAIMLNDDVVFVNSKWWQGIIDTFRRVEEATPDRPALLVNAASIKLPDWSVGRTSGDDFYILPYKEEYTDGDWDFLVSEKHYVNEHLTIQPGSVIDGINLYCSVVDMRRLYDVGYLDDFWYTGASNDYDLSCRAGMRGYRCVSTTSSWVYHHWSVTFHSEEDMRKLVQPELLHGDLRTKWGDSFDIWGILCPRCKAAGKESRFRTTDNITAVCPVHADEIYKIPPLTVEEL